MEWACILGEFLSYGTLGNAEKSFVECVLSVGSSSRPSMSSPVSLVPHPRAQ